MVPVVFQEVVNDSVAGLVAIAAQFQAPLANDRIRSNENAVVLDMALGFNRRAHCNLDRYSSANESRADLSTSLYGRLNWRREYDSWHLLAWRVALLTDGLTS
jgi:hypothetical protein